jgi:hypothetical protein
LSDHFLHETVKFHFCPTTFYMKLLSFTISFKKDRLGTNIVKNSTKDPCSLAEIDARTAETYRMVRDAVDGIAPEAYPPVTVVEEEDDEPDK